jgi:hypothetical protein
MDNSIKNSSWSNLTALPYLYYFNPLSTTALKVCVKSCPNATSTGDINTAICSYGVVPTSPADLASKINAKTCAFTTLESKTVMNRCVPKDATAALNLLQNDTSSSGTSIYDIAYYRDTAIQAFEDVYSTWDEIAISLAVALGGAIIWVILLRFTAGLLIWTLVFVMESGLIAFSVWLYFEWQNKVKTTDATITTQVWMRNAYMGFFIAFASISGLLLILLIALRNRIKIAIQIIRESSRAVVSLPTIIFVPLCTMILVIGLFVFYVIVAAILTTADSGSVSLNLTYATLAVSNLNNYLQWYLLLGLLWNYFFLQAINQTAIAGSIATYYFSRDKSALPTFTVALSIWRVLRYHLGSLAFGSLIIAIVYLIRIILLYIEQQLKGKSNKVIKFIFACLQCCFACVARFLVFLNKNAYIEIAIHGTSFCKSAKNAFQLLTRNVLRLAALDAVSGLVILFSKLFIGGSAAFYIFIRLRDRTDINFFVVPLVIAFVFGYCIGSIFLYVYEMAIDTIFLCFCEDCEQNDGSAARPFFMPDGLKKLVNSKKI